MKKNAILVAGILFVAGCAHQGGYGRAGTESGTDYSTAGLSTFDTADSTMMGNEVVQRDSRGHMMIHSPTDPTHRYTLDASRPSSENIPEFSENTDSSMEFSDSNRDIDRSARNAEAMLDQDQIIADSSERGGSMEARGWAREDGETEAPTTSLSDSDISADSSIRGGSKAARGFDDEGSTAQGGFSGADSGSGSSSSVDASANWGDDNFNPSTSFDNDGLEKPNGSLSGAANIYSNPGSEAVVEGNLYDQAPAGAQLNSSPALEENISGEYQLQERLDRDFGADDVEASGAAATSESGSQSSTETGDEESQSESALAQKVKATLTRESTGTHGLMRHQVARNITVSASEEGVVTLKGTVPSEQDKRIVGIRAAEVKGVAKVDNQLTVSPASDPASRDLGVSHDLEERTDQLKD